MTPAPQRPAPTASPAPGVEPLAEDEAAEVIQQEVETTDKVLLARASSVKHADALAPALAKIAKHRNATVLLVVGDVRLEALDEEQMRKAGWVRADQVPPAETAEQLARVIAP